MKLGKEKHNDDLSWYTGQGKMKVDQEKEEEGELS